MLIENTLLLAIITLLVIMNWEGPKKENNKSKLFNNDKKNGNSNTKH